MFFVLSFQHAVDYSEKVVDRGRDGRTGERKVVAQGVPDSRVCVMKKGDGGEAAGRGQMGDPAIIGQKKAALSQKLLYLRKLIETKGIGVRFCRIEGFEEQGGDVCPTETGVEFQETVIGPLLFSEALFRINDDAPSAIRFDRVPHRLDAGGLELSELMILHVETAGIGEHIDENKIAL